MLAPASRRCFGEKPSTGAKRLFLQWHPDRDRGKGKSKLADAETVERALSESTRAVISPDGWKLCLRDRDKNELYNLKADPGEKRNLY